MSNDQKVKYAATIVEHATFDLFLEFVDRTITVKNSEIAELESENATLASRAEKAEAERDALRCCGNCVMYAMRFSAFEPDGAKPNLLCAVRREGKEKNTPWHVCSEWEAREK